MSLSLQMGEIRQWVHIDQLPLPTSRRGGGRGWETETLEERDGSVEGELFLSDRVPDDFNPLYLFKSYVFILGCAGSPLL